MEDNLTYILQGYEVNVCWCDYRRAWIAYSNSFDHEYYPEGQGKTKAEALDDLDWQLEEFNEKWSKNRAAQ